MQPKSPQPWGRLAGLLAACGTIAMGVLHDLDPDVILVRSLVAAAAVGAIVTIVVRVISQIPSEE